MRPFADPSHWPDRVWVPGDGNRSRPRIAFVGEAPAKEEEKRRRPFVGPSGDINWLFASRYAGVGRQGNYVTNWRKVSLSPEEKKKLKPEEIEDWNDALWWELDEVNAEVIVALGMYAVDAILGKGHSTYWSNGIAFRQPNGEASRVVIPVVHPAAGMHDASLLQGTVEGYKGLGRFLRGEVQPREWRQWEPSPVAKSWREFQDTLAPVIFIDTEGLLPDGFCLQFATEASAGYIIYADDAEGVRWFCDWLRRRKDNVTIVFHHAVHDHKWVKDMFHLSFWDEGFKVEDTMVWAFNLQDIPKGLKPLTQKYLNIQMHGYEDVVGPWVKEEDDRWLAKAAARAYKDIEAVQQFTPKGKPRMSKGAPVYKLEGPELQLRLVKHVERHQQLHLDEVLWAESQVGPRPKMDLKYVPTPLAEEYAARDAAVTAGIYPILKARIDSEGLAAVADLDHQALPEIASMQEVGLHVDVDRYWEVLGELSVAKAEIGEAICALVGDSEFNPGSPLQVEQYCDRVYREEGKLHLTRLTAKKTRKSTDDNALSLVSHNHPFPELLLRWREYDKYENSYLMPMQPELTEVGPGDYRVFFDLSSTRVVSGRLAGRALTWPARTDLGSRLRSVVTAPPGMRLCAWDLSQIELRLIAAFSRDEVMLEVFQKGLDPHAMLAAKLFKQEYEYCLGGPDEKGPGRKKYRGPAKNINYMWVYGGTGGKLYDMLLVEGMRDYDREACDQMLLDTRRVYTGAARFLEEAADEACRYGYVSDWLGRRRFLPGCSLIGNRWPIAGLRYESERQAGNLKIQAANTELLKRSMVTVRERVYTRCRELGIRFRLWLWIHDELMGACDDDDQAWETVNNLMIEAMTQDSALIDPVKIETTGKWGHSWADLK